jgi:hypothetical protein
MTISFTANASQLFEMEPSPLRYLLPSLHLKPASSFGNVAKSLPLMKQQRRWVAALESSVRKSSSRPICADGNVTGIAQRAVASPTQGQPPTATWRLRDARSKVVRSRNQYFSRKRLIFK